MIINQKETKMKDEIEPNLKPEEDETINGPLEINTNNKKFEEMPDYKNMLLNSQLGGGRTHEKELNLLKGATMVKIIVPSILISAALIGVFAALGGTLLFIIPLPALVVIVCLCLTCNFITVAPNEALVLSYYGKYLGTCKEPGYYWLRPFCNSSKVSLKSNHYNGSKIKVNDKEGTPVSLGLVVVWRVRDTAKVIYDVENYQGFVITQTESAIRFVGCKYPYESSKPGEICLRSGNESINEELRQELERRVWQSGIQIEDARITEIEYGNEVAGMMLKKQTAQSGILAKEMIVKGSLDLIDYSLKEMEKRAMCKLTDEDKTKYVMNMMTLLCMDNGNKPVIKLNH